MAFDIWWSARGKLSMEVVLLLSHLLISTPFLCLRTREEFIRSKDLG